MRRKQIKSTSMPSVFVVTTKSGGNYLFVDHTQKHTFSSVAKMFDSNRLFHSNSIVSIVDPKYTMMMVQE